ncbi:MAG TPA: HAD family phosphatase [Rhodothermales bacterium]
MTNARQSVLLFDLGGVLIESVMFSELKRLMNTDRSEAELIDIWLRNPLTRRFELGRCPPEEFSRSVVREFGVNLDPAEFLASFSTWPKGFYDGAVGLLADLRSQHTVCCLSNSNEVHWTSSLTAHFDRAFSSHLIGCIKPDPEAFAYVLSEIDVPAERVHFFDDAPVNVEAARRLGLNAYHTVGFGALQAELKQLGFID